MIRFTTERGITVELDATSPHDSVDWIQAEKIVLALLEQAIFERYIRSAEYEYNGNEPLRAQCYDGEAPTLPERSNPIPSPDGLLDFLDG